MRRRARSEARRANWIRALRIQIPMKTAATMNWKRSSRARTRLCIGAVIGSCPAGGHSPLSLEIESRISVSAMMFFMR
jgi:hypothetical protein